MDLSTASDFASETGSPLISEDLPELQISHPDTRSHNLRPVSVLTNAAKDQLSIEESRTKPNLLVGMPTLNISDSNSTTQSEILLQNAGESLVDLMFDAISPKGGIGLAFLEDNLNFPPTIENADFNKACGTVPLFEGSNSETERNIPVHHIHSLNECLTLWTGEAEDFMFQIQSYGQVLTTRHSK